MTTADQVPRFAVRDILFYERPVRLRLPFRFGVVTLTEAPQVFVRARIEDAGGHSAWGAAAELLAPKWFDKNAALSNEENFQQLRRSLAIARELYLGGEPRGAFGHFAERYPDQLARCAAAGLNPLIASYGPALLDRALLDALCRICRVSFYQALRSNLPGFAAAALDPDLGDFDTGAFLKRLQPQSSIHARHTVGLADPLTEADVERPLDDGLPQTLDEVIGRYGQRYFKIKVGGDAEADLARLCAIAAVLERIEEPYHVTLDGNEQYRDVEQIVALWRQILDRPALARLADAVLFIEQPLVRDRALARGIGPLGALKPVIIDESDAGLDSFVKARDLGYRGVSSKVCKGIYRSLLNAARCAHWNAKDPGRTFFLSGEDLSTQAGIAVQQDLALVCLLGLHHVERNGHHYVDGFGAAPESEARAFLDAHPDLYHLDDGRVRLRIREGRIATDSLAAAGFAHAAEPDWDALEPMA